MHFHEKIYKLLLDYRKKNNDQFNFIVRERDRKSKNHPEGKFSGGLVFQGTDEYCFVGLIDRSGGVSSTKSVGIVVKPAKKGFFKATLDIVFPGTKNQELISFYKKLASKFDNIEWERNGTKACHHLGEFPEGDPVKLYSWLDKYYPVIRKTAIESNIEGLLPSNEKFKKSIENLNKRLKDSALYNYWVFQGNPKIFDFKSALSDNSLQDFTVSAHEDKIKVGDKVIIWLSGKQAGCYALAVITSEPFIRSESSDDKHWKKENSNTLKAGIQITNNLYENPILWEDIKDDETFANFKAGHQGTNFRATKKEYSTLLNMAESKKFTWVRTYREIIQYLKDKKNQQKELIELLKTSGCENFNDKELDGRTIPLEEIDPFTFLCYLNKYFKQRVDILQNLAEKINATKPYDDLGLPSANPQKVLMFPYKPKRVNNEIDSLWSLFYDVLKNTITDNQFEDILKIPGIGKTKITEVFFYVNPEKYFPINRPVKAYLKNEFDINPEFTCYQDYLDILKQLREKSNKPFYQLSYEAWLWNDHFQNSEVPSNKKRTMEKPVNQLFFGPPGTGKTYSTLAEAVKIIDQGFYEANKNDRNALVNKYRASIITEWENTKGQIAFCTFHQSFTYEDFVEGIKPKTTNEKNVYYDIEPGIFKRICDLAHGSKSSNKLKNDGKFNWTKRDFRNALFYKISLGEASNPQDKEIFEFCKENGYIAIGFGGAINYNGKSESEIKELCKENDPNDSAGSQLSAFIHSLSTGDYIIVSKGNSYVRAIGKVLGEYEYHEDFPIDYNHFRKVEWVMIDNVIPVKDLYHKKFTQRSIYKLKHDEIREDFFVQDHDKVMYNEEVEEDIKPYVILIDEINRGNVSSIFGELITLIEPDKRAGASEELKVILPYSKEEFSVPDNVYIIATMNTADRSIEALDSALRRRFQFVEMLPDYDLIDQELNHLQFEGYKLSEILKTINERIAILINRDHQIGHSYFLNLKGTDNLEKDLKHVFMNKIIPLLQEYFFNDYVKIAMVLGEGFMDKHKYKNVKFANNDGEYDSDYRLDITYEIKKDVDLVEAIHLLMDVE